MRRTHLNPTAIEDGFRRAIEQAGLTPPDAVMADGRLHRFPTNGHRDDDSGWYVYHDGDIPAGAFGDWRLGIKETWCSKSDRQMTKAEREAHQQRLRQIQRQREDEERRRHAQAAAEAERIWNAAKPAIEHPYLLRKQVQPHGLRVHTDGRLVVPGMTLDGTITTVQFIDDDGNKLNLCGGKVKGSCFGLGDLTNVSVVVAAEGFATAASLHEATGHPVVVAFDAGNLLPVAQALRTQYPDAKILIAGDNDFHADGKPNTGRIAATAAAQAVNGLLAIPDMDGKKCDWNDVARDGLDAVRLSIAAALSPEASILDEVYAFLGRFVCYPSEPAHVAHTLWTAHTHLMDAWESTPRIAFLSPEPGSGKTRALELTETVVPNPVEAINVSPAFLFRRMADPKGLPTILYDEVDTVFGPRAKENEELRGLLNAGHRRGAMCGRCVVKGWQIETEEFPAFCAVALAGLGGLPDTVLTRSIVIRMQRRAPTERVEPYRRRIHAPEGYALRNRLAVWAVEIRPRLNTNPMMPDGIADRDADVWEALLAIAYAVGGDWPARARVAAVTLVTSSMGDRGSLGVRLLADLRSIFGEAAKLATTELLDKLVALEESPWGDWKGKPLDARKLSFFLKPYGIGPKPLRIGRDVFKGYERSDLLDAWTRYLPPEDSLASPSPKERVTDVTAETTEATNVGLSHQEAVTSVTEDTAQPGGEEPIELFEEDRDAS